MTLPDADPDQLLDAFLRTHAQHSAIPATLYARGEELHRRLAGNPPAIPAWGRFLVAMGHLAAEAIDDPDAAARYFLAALQGAEKHGDLEAAVTAGYDMGVLQERRGKTTMARAAYRAAANEGFRLGVVTANTLRAATAAVRLHFELDGHVDPEAAALAKRGWLGWLWLRRHHPEQLDRELASTLGRQLAALLLPEDDPGLLAAAWRAWPPTLIPTATGPWRDDRPECLVALFTVAALAADEHLQDEVQSGNAPGDPYRMLAAAAGRHRPEA